MSNSNIGVSVDELAAGAVRKRRVLGSCSLLKFGAMGILLASSCASGSASDTLTPDAQDTLAQLEGDSRASAEQALLASAPQYFSVVSDPRRCASPRCGGYFVRAVNRLMTRCADGSLADRCYVAEIDWPDAGGEPPGVGPEWVVQGSIESNVFPDFGDLGRLVAVDAWSSATRTPGAGAYFRLADNGIRCITEPCFSIDAELVNVGVTLQLSDLDLSAVGATDEQLTAASEALAHNDLIAAGRLRLRTGTAGLGVALRSSQFYLPPATPAGSSCASDADCPDGAWCRVTQAGSYACVPFAGEGERCDGFTVPWMYEQCSPKLQCDLPEFVVDAPGVCRRPCASNADCANEEYCSADGLCHADGTCDLSLDCAATGNDYIHILCLGYPTCPRFSDGDRCGWTCGDARCQDLYGVDFGPCEAVLGWAVVDGACQAVSGCSSGNYQLFSSEAECASACSG